MVYLFCVLSGIFLGVLFTFIFVKKGASGTLKVYIPDDPEESSYLYVELDRSIDFICEQRHVVFKVDAKTIKTHK